MGVGDTVMVPSHSFHQLQQQSQPHSLDFSELELRTRTTLSLVVEQREEFQYHLFASFLQV